MTQYIFFIIFTVVLVIISTFSAGISLLSIANTVLIKRICISFAVGVPLLFMLAVLLFRYYPNTFSQVLYTISAYIGGFFFYWFIGSIVVSVLFVLSRYIAFPYVTVSWVVYGLGALCAIVGFIQAFGIRTVTYTIKTPEQYTQLKGKNIVLVADTHLGPVNQDRFSRKVVEKIETLKPDAVLIAGDMFDGPGFNTSGVEQEWKKLTTHVPVIFTPGNHEEYGPFSEFMASAKRAGMTVLVDEKTTLFDVPVFGLNYRMRKNRDEVKALLSAHISPQTPAIVLNHEPSFQEQLTQAGVFLVVSGHTHNGQFWPGNILARRIYKEYTYGLVSKGTFQSVTTNGVGTAILPMRTFNTGEIVVLHFI